MYKKLLSLLLIVTINSSFIGAPLYPNQNHHQALRPASNGVHKAPLSFKPQAPAPAEDDFRGERRDGHITIVPVFDGVVDVDGVLVAAGDTYEVEPSVLRSSSAGEKEAISSEFGGGPLDTVGGQFRAYHMALQKVVNKIPKLTKNKYIEFNTDFLPDFGLAADSAESPQKRLVEAVLEAVAHRIVQYKRGRNFGWQDNKKIYLDFVSRSGNTVKNDKIKKLFTREKMQVVKDHDLDELLGSAPVGTAKSDKIIITYKGDASKLEYPSLFLKETLMSAEKIRAYPLHTIIDLAVVILTIDRTVEDISQEPGYSVIKELLRYLLKDGVDFEKDEGKELLKNFLSEDLQDIAEAALKLALPPVEEVDFEAIEDIYRITTEAAKWA